MTTAPSFDPQVHIQQAMAARGAQSMFAPAPSNPLGPSNPLRHTHTYDLPAQPVRPWDITLVRSAIDLVGQGFLQDAAILSQYMRRDSTFASAMEKRVLGLLRSDLIIRPASDDPLDQEVADAVRRFLPLMMPEAEMRRFVEWYHLLQFAVASVDWDCWHIDSETGRMWTLPKMRARNMHWFYFDVSRWQWMDISYSGVTPVDPTDGHYAIAGTLQYGYFAGKVCELAEDWIEKTFCRRDAAEWRDYNSWPAFKVTVPASAGDTDQNDNFGNAAQAVQNNVRQRVVVCQKDEKGNSVFDFETVKVGGDEWQVYPTTIEYLDRKMQVSWLGGNLTSEVVDQGARAASITQQSAQAELIKSDSALIGAALRDSIIRFFVTENFGHDVAVPDIEWQVSLKDEQALLAKSLESVANALKNLPPNFVLDNLGEVMQQFGLRMRQTGPTLPSAPSQERAQSVERRTIKKVAPGKWRLYSKSGENLGTFPSLEAAKKHEKQVNYFKSKKRAV